MKYDMESEIRSATVYFREDAARRQVPRWSRLAGVRDHGGGIRTVVAPLRSMPHNVVEGEVMHILPRVRIAEPVEWNDIPRTVRLAERWVLAQETVGSPCGTCTECCRELYISDGEFEKPSRHWCGSCSKDVGCKIYPKRPDACKRFKCVWLQSQERNDRMPADLRPDRCGAIFVEDTQTNDPLLIECHGEPGARAWQWIDEVQASGFKVKKITHYIGER